MRLGVAVETIVVPAVVAAIALAAPAAARADVFGVVDVAQGTTGRYDIGLFDASTGAQMPLPAGIDTAVDEDHPSISADGTKLVFERRDQGTTRVLLTQLPSGATTDLFNGFEQASNPHSEPSISPDGGTVVTGEPFQGTAGQASAAVTLTSLPSLTRSAFAPPYTFAQPTGTTGDAVTAGLLVAYQEARSGIQPEIILGHLGAGAPFPLSQNNAAFAHPAIGAGILAFDKRTLLGTGLGPGDIAFEPLTGFPSTPTLLPALVNSQVGESRPAFTPDGRYLGFVRHKDGSDRMFVWDSETQTLINPGGVDLGGIDGRDIGNLSLYERAVLAPLTIVPPVLSGTIQINPIQFNLLLPSGIGILVQRVVGHQRLLGRRAPKLRLVGRVPLGKFSKGRGHVHWNGRVNGRKLPRGTYQVTVRAVSPKGAILDLGTPHTVRVK
jgi:hypothetical protein